MFDSIHNQELLLLLASMCKQMSHPYIHREKLSLQYAIRIDANPSNPVHVSFPPKCIDLSGKKPKIIIWHQLISHLKILKSINFTKIIPALCLKKHDILFDLHSAKDMT